MNYVLTSSDLQKVKLLKEQMDDTFIRTTDFYQLVITECIGIENLTPEDIHDYIEEIESIDESVLQESDENGPGLVGRALGLSSNMAANLMRDPKSASVIFRALRDKLEESQDRLQRANAEKRGLIASLVYTIKKAIIWIINKFKEIKDDVMDTVYNRPMGTSSAKRDYEWLKKHSDGWMSGNTGWYHAGDNSTPIAQ